MPLKVWQQQKIPHRYQNSEGFFVFQPFLKNCLKIVIQDTYYVILDFAEIVGI